MITAPNTCHVCGSNDLAWQTVNRNIGPSQDGRLRSSEVQCIFFLGCNDCSETLMVRNADQIAQLLDEAWGFNVADRKETASVELVYGKLSPKALQRTSIDNVKDVLEALR